MKHLFIFVLLLISVPFTANAELPDYELRKYETAQEHYDYAYQNYMPFEGSVFHYGEAAKKGHEKALRRVLDLLFYRAANNYKKADLALAMEIYNQAVSVNPAVRIIKDIAVLEKCIEVGADKFDLEAYINEHDLENLDITENFYYFWERAREHGAKMQEGDDQLLPLKLVCRTGWVPNELAGVVNELYNHHIYNEKPEFDICDHVTSEHGKLYCNIIED